MQQFLRESNHFLPKSNLFLLHSLLSHHSVTFLFKTLHYFGVFILYYCHLLWVFPPFNLQHYPLVSYIHMPLSVSLSVSLEL